MNTAKRIIICGGSGLIGQALIQKWHNKHPLTLITRHRKKTQQKLPMIDQHLSWSQLNIDTLKAHDVLINLAGANIGSQRWSAKRKQTILNSRIDTTTHLANLLEQISPTQRPHWLNASAIGFYGQQNTANLKHCVDETNSEAIHNDYLSEIATHWENAAGTQAVTLLRFAVVLSPDGGALAKMLPSFRLGLGATLGDGEQCFSWVALADVVKAIDFLIEHPEVSGPINIVADQVVNQKAFAKSLAKACHRPCLLKLPKGVVKGLFGEMGETLLLKGQCVRASRLKALGFCFDYPNLDTYFERFIA
jgi:uncharacterized protein (TIGR01777 family)